MDYESNLEFHNYLNSSIHKSVATINKKDFILPPIINRGLSEAKIRGFNQSPDYSNMSGRSGIYLSKNDSIIKRDIYVNPDLKYMNYKMQHNLMRAKNSADVKYI